MRDASNEVTDIDMNMSERHVGKNAAFAIDIMFVRCGYVVEKNGHQSK